MFQSGVVQGSIFPKFAAPEIPVSQIATAESVGAIPDFSNAAAVTLPERQKFVLPINATDYALLFLWRFIAGFAERFVPNALERLISRTDAFSKAPPPPAARTEGIAPLARGVTEPEAQSGEIKQPSPADSRLEPKARSTIQS
jgi:hypothetical protein